MGDLHRVQLEALFPPEHPYGHEVIGSMADLDAATEADIKSFFARYYAPNNATLLVAGDFDVAKVKGLIEKYFAPIPAGPPVVRKTIPEVKTNGERRIAMEAKVNAFEYTTWSEFKAAVHIICIEVTLTMQENVYSSMTKRMRLVIEKGGGKTDY